ncbi:type IV conjugative transfer system coupling protein TraD [Rahnella variigena]|jgi:type IV conjugative transfer system coupling protein TraD|uniref:type IV conjugative transfer system coupling protein TraD n=1 Tax=Rahnella variigena TaxID=574964 RepID=UPI0028DBCD1F|nr:type IV conjugative transfer system coupling protein TraD [Rahnella variigena]
MSFNSRDFTQGGQVAFMRLRMFLQINHIISFYMIMSFMIITVATLFIRMSTQNIMNGLMYWYATTIAPFQKHIVNPTVYHLDYYGKKLNYTAMQIVSDSYTSYCGQLLKQEIIISALISLVMVFIGTGVFFWYLGHLGKKQSEDEITGGRVLNTDPKAVAKMMKSRDQASDIKVDDLPIKKDSEIQNFGMHGTVGSGKSTLMRKFLSYLRERGDLVIIYDKGCTFVEEYYDASKDKLLNPQDERCANWDMWGECPTLPSLETISTSLIPMGASEDPFWQGSARTIFSEAAHRMRKDRDLSYNKFLRTLLAIKLDKLREFLAGTPAATLVDGKIEKTAISIRSVLTNYVKAMRYLQGIDRSGKPKFTIREWMQGTKVGAKNPWLFITSNQQHHESLKPVISMWLSIAADSLLSMGENRHRRVWFFYDELPSLHKLPGLPFIIAEARKFGGCFLLGFQSYPQLEEIYGNKSAEAMFDLLNTKYFFRSPSALVSKFVAEDIGETVRKRFSEQTSFGNESVRDGISFGKEEERINIVSHTDVQKLEDLECFVTLPGDYPVVKMALKYQKLPKVAEAILERDVESSLDPEIEEDLERRGAEESMMDALFSQDAPVETPPVATTLPAIAAVIPAGSQANMPPSPVPANIVMNTDSAPGATTPVAAAVAATGSAETASAGGRDEEIDIELPPGMSEDGEIVDFDAYEQYAAQSETQDATRREEVNINHSRAEKGNDERDGGFYL